MNWADRLILINSCLGGGSNEKNCQGYDYPVPAAHSGCCSDGERLTKKEEGNTSTKWKWRRKAAFIFLLGPAYSNITRHLSNDAFRYGFVLAGGKMDIQQTSVAGTMESSDIMITLEPGSGTIEIELQSMMEKQFGRQIRMVIVNTLEEFNVKSAKVTAVDKGALDYTIQARVKAAVFRASLESAYKWRIPV
jgi:citrate lyase subunit gamma (acyl carrier protein)